MLVVWEGFYDYIKIGRLLFFPIWIISILSFVLWIHLNFLIVMIFSTTYIQYIVHCYLPCNHTINVGNSQLFFFIHIVIKLKCLRPTKILNQPNQLNGIHRNKKSTRYKKNVNISLILYKNTKKKFLSFFTLFLHVMSYT